MLLSPDFQIVKSRVKKYDVLIHTPYLERDEAELFLGYYLLRNIETMVYMVLGVELLPYQGMILRMLLKKSFPMLILTRGGAKTFLLGIYSALRSLISHGSHVVIVGANRRQSLFVFEEMSKAYYGKNGGLFRECCPKPPNCKPEESSLIVKSGTKFSKISSYPLASGDRIRGARSSHMIVDEANLIPESIFDTILKPMSAVAMNPVERVKILQRERALVEAGVIKEGDRIEFEDNQIILSSSAGYCFQYLYKQYKEYRQSILNSVEFKKPSQHAIIQIGWEAINQIAPGYLDLSAVENSRITSSKDRFDSEYGAQFVSDSAGFYPRSLLERQTIKVNELPSVEIKAESNNAYIMAIDPSSAENEKNDFFGIGIGKIDTTNHKIYLVNADGQTGKGWTYHVQLVREYIREFSPKYIIMDKFGGGSNLASLLQAEEYLDKEKGDQIIRTLEKDDIFDYNATMNKILRLVVFTSDWIEQSNINLKSNLDHGHFWFASKPTEAAYSSTEAIANKFDNADDSITECKNELSLIIGEQNDRGLTSFKMPESLGAIHKKQRVRKDLYVVCLLLAWGLKEYLEILGGNKKKSERYSPVFSLV